MRETLLWSYVCIVFGLLDLTTTFQALQIGGIESNPIGEFLLSFGFEYLIIFKILVISYSYFVYWVFRKNKYKDLIPLGLISLGLIVFANNFIVVLYLGGIS